MGGFRLNEKGFIMKRLLIVFAMIFVLSFLVSCGVNAPTPSPITVGDQPTHIALADCSDLVQSAIQSKGLPIDLIHSCKDENITLDTGEEVILISIQYGEGMDCPSGCIYEKYTGLSTDENHRLIDLPDVSIENEMWGRPPFNEWRTWWTENHSSKSYQTVAMRNGYYGWVLELEYYRFTLLYWKSSGPDAQMGKRLYSSSGEIFVFFDTNGIETWDYSRFKTVTEDIQ
jgi:hypothetical protein